MLHLKNYIEKKTDNKSNKFMDLQLWFSPIDLWPFCSLRWRHRWWEIFGWHLVSMTFCWLMSLEPVSADTIECSEILLRLFGCHSDWRFLHCCLQNCMNLDRGLRKNIVRGSLLSYCFLADLWNTGDSSRKLKIGPGTLEIVLDLLDVLAATICQPKSTQNWALINYDLG